MIAKRQSNNAWAESVAVRGFGRGFSKEKTINSSPTKLDDQKCDSVTIQAKYDNESIVYLGFEDGQYIELAPGDSIAVNVVNTGLLYIKGEPADGINYMGVY